MALKQLYNQNQIEWTESAKPYGDLYNFHRRWVLSEISTPTWQPSSLKQHPRIIWILLLPAWFRNSPVQDSNVFCAIFFFFFALINVIQRMYILCVCVFKLSHFPEWFMTIGAYEIPVTVCHLMANHKGLIIVAHYNPLLCTHSNCYLYRFLGSKWTRINHDRVKRMYICFSDDLWFHMFVRVNFTV